MPSTITSSEKIAGAYSKAKDKSALSLRHNFAWTLAGNVVYAGCQWAMLVVLAKLGSPVKVGQFALGLAIAAPVFMFFNLQLRAVQATDAKSEYHFSDYLGLRIVSTILALSAILGFALITGNRKETLLVILAVGLAKVFESISDILYGLLQCHERMDRIAKSMMIKGPLSLVALGVGVYVTGSVLWGAIGLAAAWAVLLIIYDIRSGKFIQSLAVRAPETIKIHDRFISVRPRWDMRVLLKLAWVALPLGFVMMLVSLNVNVPRYFVEYYFGERQLGIFAAMAYLVVAENTVVVALGQSVSPRLAKYFASGNVTAFRSLILKLGAINALLGGIGVLAALVAGKDILALLYRPEYAQHVNAFVWLMVAAGISNVASALEFGMTSARYFKIQMPLFVLVVGALVAACYFVVPEYGLLGAAIALTIGALIELSFCGAVMFSVFTKLRLSSDPADLPKSQKEPVKILHVVGGMNRGGVETWLMQVLRNIDRDRFEVDFLVHTTQPADFDNEIRAYGSKIIPCPATSRPLVYARDLRRILREYGPYDVVHSHVLHFSGYVLRTASQAGVKKRIAHSHSDTSKTQAKAKLLRGIYLALMRHWIKSFATTGLAVSQNAASALYGENWALDSRYEVSHCGIDLAPFKNSTVDPYAIRAAVGLPEGAFVVGHVGRFVEPKNHAFIIEVAEELIKQDPEAYFLLVGDGPLRSHIERTVEEKGLTGRVIFAGVRSNVPDLLLGGMDVFVFPSLFEGLGLALIEAQAAGLPCVVSNVITEEVDVVKPLIQRLSLVPSSWAEAISAIKEQAILGTRQKASSVIESSAFNIANSICYLEALYGRE